MRFYYTGMTIFIKSLPEEAVKGSMDDVSMVEGKITEEDEANILKWFKDTKEDTNKRMDFLTTDFESMKTNCADDIKLTG